MIIDCHTRVWASPAQLGAGADRWLAANGGQPNLPADIGAHAAAAAPVARTLVWGFRSRCVGGELPNSFVADHVAQHADRMIGVAAVDPLEDDCLERLANIAQRPEFKAVTISPAAQGFHPAHSLAWRVYEFCIERHLPVFVEPASTWGPPAVLEYARPALLDEVCRSLPELTLVVARAGWPWVDETLALLARHERAFADIAGLPRRTWECYQTLLTAHQRGLADRLLFGSDFPFSTPAQAIERLYRLGEMTHGTSLPQVPREVLRSIVERDALAALGLA